MKKLLPKSAKNPQGFTLVELLIVVSIIAILAVIGLVIFGNFQKNARDARRKADINSIATAMESNYNETTGQYKALAVSMFSGGVIPKDPLTGTNCSENVCKYCSLDSEGDCTTTSDTVGIIGTVSVPAAGTDYVVCANLEAGGHFCRSSQRSIAPPPAPAAQ